MIKDIFSLDEAAYAQHINHQEVSLNQIEILRDKISDEYLDAIENGDLKLRQFPKILEEAMVGSKTGVITLNWDNLLWSEPRYVNLIQLHGSIESPGTLVFPTENMIDHEFMLNILRKGELQQKEEIFTAAYDRSGRGEYQYRELNLAYFAARNWIRDCKNIIIYGIAGHIYDVELHSLFLGTGDTQKASVTVLDVNDEVIKRWRGILAPHDTVFNGVLLTKD